MKHPRKRFGHNQKARAKLKAAIQESFEKAMEEIVGPENRIDTDNIGNKYYYQNDTFHRLDGPAIEYIDGDTFWYQHGLLHRLDGPAMEYDTTKSWYYKGRKIFCSSQQEFEKILKLKAFW